MLLVDILKCMFLIKNLRVYNIGKLSAAFSLSGPLCATFPYRKRERGREDAVLYEKEWKEPDRCRKC